MGGWGVNVVGLGAVLDLLDEIQMRFDGDVTYVAGPTVEYAVWHEIGTSKMEARPFAEPAAARVQADPLGKTEAIAASQGIDISSEEGLVRAMALAVQREMKEIIRKKEIWDTGQMHASVTIERVT